MQPQSQVLRPEDFEDGQASKPNQDQRHRPASLPRLELEPIDDATVSSIYRADQEIYPSSLTLERLMLWLSTAGHHFSHAFMADVDDFPSHIRPNPASGAKQVLAGTLITLPLKKGAWEDLLCGKLLEPDIDVQHLVSSQPEQVGLHVFHIEKEEACPIRGFAKQALESLAETAHAGGWNVVGYSALTATPAGKASFTKLGFKSTGFLERIVTPRDGTDQDGTRQFVKPLPDALPPAVPDTHVVTWQAEMLKLDAIDSSIGRPRTYKHDDGSK